MRLLPASLAANIRLGTTARPRLINGLPLHRNLSRNTYLAGGEPDLELPVGAEARDVEVKLDEDRQPDLPRLHFPDPLLPLRAIRGRRPHHRCGRGDADFRGTPRIRGSVRAARSRWPVLEGRRAW